MDRNRLNYLIDLLLAISFVAVVVIGALLGFVIPRGPSAPGQTKYLWGLHRHEWGDIHLVLSIAMVVLLVVHILLHWEWVRVNTSRIFGRLWVLVIIIVVAAGGLLIAGWFLYPQGSRFSGHEEHAGQRQYRGGRQEAVTEDPCASCESAKDGTCGVVQEPSQGKENQQRQELPAEEGKEAGKGKGPQYRGGR